MFDLSQRVTARKGPGGTESDFDGRAEIQCGSLSVYWFGHMSNNAASLWCLSGASKHTITFCMSQCIRKQTCSVSHAHT